MASILVIDDDSQVRFLVQAMLKRGGYEVAVASNGREGVESFERNPVDLVITDLIMPEKEGLETIQELRQKFPSLKIIAMSGGLRQGAIDFLPVAKKLGASKVLAKPFQRDQLLEAVREVLGQTGTPEATMPPKA